MLITVLSRVKPPGHTGPGALFVHGPRTRAWGFFAFGGLMAVKRKRGREWRALRTEALRRDSTLITRHPDGSVEVGARCWICHEPIDYSLKSPSPYAWEPDHVIPVDLRPDLEYDLGNLAPSHVHCNRSRGDGTRAKRAPGELGTPSRRWGPPPAVA